MAGTGRRTAAGDLIRTNERNPVLNVILITDAHIVQFGTMDFIIAGKG